VRLPADESGFEHGPEIAAHIKVACAGASEEPLDRAADSEIDIERANVDG
jgi:hypothetical protein